MIQNLWHRRCVGALVFLVLSDPLRFSLAQDPNPPPAEPSAARATPAPTTPADARDLFMEGHYQRAIEAYQSLAKDPRHVLEAGLGLARCNMQRGEYEEAVESLIRLDARDNADWHYLLARLLRVQGEYEDVLTHARAAAGLDDDHAGARLLLGETLELLGRRDEATEAYRWFERQLVGRDDLPHDAAWVTDTALGFLRYSVLTQTRVARRTQYVLNELLQVAYERLDRTWWPARIAAADLLREKYNNDEADGSVSDYEAALRINDQLPDAHVGLGEVLLEAWNFEEVEWRVGLALDVNPNHPGALHLLAKKYLLERRYEQAKGPCERALAVNPNDLMALSLRAAAGAGQYDAAEVERLRARVAAVSPKNSLFHRTLGDALAGIRQYADAEREYRKAIDFDPTDANARTELGMMYMQWGLEDKARDALEGSWALDPFNQRTKFTLELLESLEEFARCDTEHFIVRYDAERDPGLGEYVAPYLESIYEPVTGDYETPLPDKTIVEVFPTQRKFGVRITGKPWIHTIGACTGRVIALASPRESTQLMGPYNIARVLKHEFTHTVTLAATRNRIPHWFTEGLAVSQEDSPRSFYWSQLLAEAVRRDELFTLESIDWGFIRPRRPTDRQMAYAQSEWMAEYIVERFGYDSINAMLRRFRDGQTQSQVFTKQFGIEPADFDRDFEKWAGRQAATWGFDLTPPEDVATLSALVAADENNAALQGRLARAAYDQADSERALTAARRALEINENERTALEIWAKVQMSYAREEQSEQKRRAYEDEALRALERLWTLDPEGWTAPKHLAEVWLRRNERDRALEPLKRLQRLCPLDPTSWRGLAGLYVAQERHDLALPQLLELARIEENDPDVPKQIARIYRRKGRLRDAQYWYQRALYINPSGVDLHQALGDTHMLAGDTVRALHEYKMLARLEPRNPRHFEDAAKAAHKLGNAEEARELARQALELDPVLDVHSLLP